VQRSWIFVFWGLFFSMFVAGGCSDDDSGGARCGDGVVNPELGEECDGRALGGRTCEDVDPTSLGGVLKCHPVGSADECTFDLSQCAFPECGNGTVEAGEECDGYDLQGASCQSLGHDAGQLLCTGPESANPCTLDESECLDSPYCGDGNVDVAQGEVCDGGDMNGETCESLGFLGGTLRCDLQCQYDTSQCDQPVCGNDTREATEVCDGSDLADEDCISRGYLEGTLACGNDCLSFDESGCSGHPVCGDGVIEGNEVCDGTNLAGQTCVSRGYLEGDLACGGNCVSFDEAGCSGTNNCVPDHQLGTLQQSVAQQVTGDFAQATDDNALSCGSMMQPDVTVQFTLPQGGEVEVQYDFGMMAMSSTLAMFSAASANCDDLELECTPGETGPGPHTHVFTGLAAGTYYLIFESLSIMGGTYTVDLTFEVGEDCSNGIDDNGNGLTDCEDGIYCCSEAVCQNDPGYCLEDGAGCTTDASCAGGFCLDEPTSGFPGGMCTRDCSAANVCSTDFECIIFNDASQTEQTVCLPLCAGGSSNECGSGFVCVDLGNQIFTCFPDCVQGSDCPDTGQCNLYSGFCGATGALEPDGGPCTANADCESGLCMTEADFGAPGGYCISTCSLDSPFCPDSNVCIDYFGTAADDGYCFTACPNGNECRTNYTCGANTHNPPPNDAICDW
jgi:hypothetical protein